MTSPTAGVWPLDESQRLLVALADDELLVGHVLVSGAGWGPELELNIALSSIGQDEIGHARRLYEHVLADRDEVERFVYERPADEFRASALTRSYPRRWEDLLVRQYLYETADAHRLRLLCGSKDAATAGQFAEMVPEETYHHDFWTTWWQSTQHKPSGRDRMQASLDAHWPAAVASFVPGGAVEAFARVVGVDPVTVRTAQDSWLAEVGAACRAAGLTLPDSRLDPSQDALADILDEMRVVYSTAPGNW